MFLRLGTGIDVERHPPSLEIPLALFFMLAVIRYHDWPLIGSASRHEGFGHDDVWLSGHPAIQFYRGSD